MLKFIANNSDYNHNALLNELIRSSSEIFIAVAFFKMSGFDLIRKSLASAVAKKSKVVLICGSDFGLTDPQALREIKKLFDKSATSKLYFTFSQQLKGVFHPKVYMFKQGNDCIIVSGSANLTSGGLESNHECSLVVRVGMSDAVAVNTQLFFDDLIKSNFCKEATLLQIMQYEKFFNEQKNIRKLAKVKPEVQESVYLQFNYENLLDFYNQYKREHDIDGIFKKREQDYKTAKDILDSIANSKNLTKIEFASQFEKLVGSKTEINLWHSGSIYRKKTTVFEYYKEFQDLVKFVRDNGNQSPSIVFSEAKEMVKKIEGSGVNTITEIMMTYNPLRFANLNKNPITVLSDAGGVEIKASANSFSGQDYENYCDLVSEISMNFNLRNMLEADSFFNDIYWKIQN